jgi:N6-adenosine-specific RNA methylase IME4|tara:strand:- start:42 stop:581 length:540 start_codon:yes stop_codon:yes gene_type:complete
MNNLPNKKYQIIYADPPWTYNNFQGKGKSHGDVSAHYKTLSLNQIKQLPINQISDDNCILFLWVTYPNLIEGIEVLKSWQFVYKTVAFTWVKTNKKGSFYSGLGFYTNSNCEICLIGRKGKFKRHSKKVKQLVIDNLREHSRKPDCVRDRIVELCGDLPRIELFARQKTPGWDVWGNEI